MYIITADPSCGHSTRYNAGLVHSPSLNSDWIDSHLDCEWEIESTGDNSGIQLLITKMHIHNVDFVCNTDYLQVYSIQATNSPNFSFIFLFILPLSTFAYFSSGN